MDVLLIAVLTLLNGVFAMSEMAIASSRKALLLSMAEDGDRGAMAALRLMEHPTQFLSTVQVGITATAILNGIVGESIFSASLAHWFEGFGLAPRPAGTIATALVVAAITAITIVLGELVPKRIGQLNPEQVARRCARPMALLARIAGPVAVTPLTKTTQAILKLLRIDVTRGRGMTEEEIAHSLEEGVDAGVIEQHEHQMVQNVFHLDDRPLTSMMVPRSDIEWLDAGLTPVGCIARIASGDAHSWYPVCRGSLDDVVGMVSVAVLLGKRDDDRTTLDQLASAAIFVPETLTGMELLEQFRAKSGRMVFVVDEYGVVQGLMTPHDLLEAITGELKPHANVQAWATQRDDGSWLLDGLMPVSELKARLEIRDLPGEDRGLYNTLAGLLMTESGRLPATGERIDVAQWRFEVVDLDGKRIDKVLASHAPRAELYEVESPG
ncbi:MAG TPA: hemolysin family protein [Ramlibacter sp.]